MVSQTLVKRSLLVVGPPHSGKSVFSYLLFKYLRENGNDAALIDCDIFNPTFRPYKIPSVEEDNHVYPVGHVKNKTLVIAKEMYARNLDLLLTTVREKGIIVMDGVGKHTEITDVLLECCSRLAIICKEGITPKEMLDSYYLENDSPCHPFTFYGRKTANPIRINTHKEVISASFNIPSLEARLHGLSRSAIQLGSVDKIPADTRSEITSMAMYLRTNWGM